MKIFHRKISKRKTFERKFFEWKFSLEKFSVRLFLEKFNEKIFLNFCPLKFLTPHQNFLLPSFSFHHTFSTFFFFPHPPSNPAHNFSQKFSSSTRSVVRRVHNRWWNMIKMRFIHVCSAFHLSRNCMCMWWIRGTCAYTLSHFLWARLRYRRREKIFSFLLSMY